MNIYYVEKQDGSFLFTEKPEKGDLVLAVNSLEQFLKETNELLQKRFFSVSFSGSGFCFTSFSEEEKDFNLLRDTLKKKITDLEGLKARTINVLRAKDIFTLGDIVRCSDISELKILRGFGRIAEIEVLDVLEDYNLGFGMPVDKILSED